MSFSPSRELSELEKDSLDDGDVNREHEYDRLFEKKDEGSGHLEKTKKVSQSREQERRRIEEKDER